MNSYVHVGMTMVKKEQGQDDYFNQQSILLKITSLEKTYALLIEIIILSLFFFNHCHSYIAVYFIEMFFITCL